MYSCTVNDSNDTVVKLQKYLITHFNTLLKIKNYPK